MANKTNSSLLFSKRVNDEIRLRSFDEIVETEVKNNTIFNRNLF